ncbi:serine protease FAM111A [Ranitomeya imitator]|uniref:serine protease FAM111A n=1 Tax=Ranitomeya imitator TaxID=111125 RepID=UPI0037E89AC1
MTTPQHKAPQSAFQIPAETEQAGTGGTVSEAAMKNDPAPVTKDLLVPQNCEKYNQFCKHHRTSGLQHLQKKEDVVSSSTFKFQKTHCLALGLIRRTERRSGISAYSDLCQTAEKLSADFITNKVYRFLMAEDICNHLDPSAHLDKENQPNSVELNQTNRALMPILTPLQDSQSCNLAANSPVSTRKVPGQLNDGRTNDSKWLTDLGKKNAQKKSEKTQNMEKTPGRKKPSAAARRAKAAGKNQNTVSSAADETESPPPKRARSEVSGEELDAECEGRQTSPVSKDISVTYEWGKKENKVKVSGNNTMFDIMEQNHGVKLGGKHLLVFVKGCSAVMNPWVPCGALKEGEKLKIILKNIKPPEPSDYPNFSDLKCFIVSDLKEKTNKTRKMLHDSRYSDNKPLIVFGYKGETIRDALQRDTRFNVTSEQPPIYLSIYSENLRAELNSSVPCGALEEGEELTVSIRKGKSPEPYKYPLYPDGMFLKLEDKGSNLKAKLHEKHYYNKKPLAVYGNKDRSIREALTNDKRFNVTQNFVLQHSDGADISSELPLSHLKQKNFYVISKKKKNKPKQWN